MKADTKKLLEDIKLYYGIDLTGYNLDFSHRVIKKHMLLESNENFDKFSKELLQDEYKLKSFINKHFISVSDMFRDRVPFIFFRKQVVEDLRSYPVIKVWSCGSATGEEALSVAIILKEAGLYDRSIIYATDINPNALLIARNSVYSIENLIPFTENYYLSGGKEEFSKYYSVDWKKRTISFDRSLLKNIYYSTHNIITDNVFNRFEVVFCRNVFMYFNQELQEKSLKLVTDSLEHSGYLFLGNSENIIFSEIKKKFSVVDSKNRIFKKIFFKE
jgi:chemotaxis protein methyltransferase CheR